MAFCHIRDMVDRFAGQFFLVKGKYVAERGLLEKLCPPEASSFNSLSIIKKLHYFWKRLVYAVSESGFNWK